MAIEMAVNQKGLLWREFSFQTIANLNQKRFEQFPKKILQKAQ